LKFVFGAFALGAFALVAIEAVRSTTTTGAAKAPPTGDPKVLTTTLKLSSADDGQTFAQYRISTKSGDCVDINGASKVTFVSSNIGPCAGRGIYINGGSGNRIYDSYIHVEGPSRRCCDTRDGILVRGSSSTTIQGNVVAYSESNIEIFGNDTVIVGNFLLNPQGVYPRGQQIQTGAGVNVRIADNFLVSTRDAILGPAIGTSSNAPILMSQGLASNPPEDSISIYTTQYADIEGNFVTGGLDATVPRSGGAQSPSGCGILGADGDRVLGANHVTIKNNVVLNTGQCGIGIATGADLTVIGNKVLNLNPNTGGNTAIYVWKQYAPACGPVLLSGNIATEVRSGGYSSGYWDGGGCSPVTCDGANANINSCNTFDYGSGRTAHRMLLADSGMSATPRIPPIPRRCVADSPYSSQSSLPRC
jgi:hypothetical protein